MGGKSSRKGPTMIRRYGPNTRESKEIRPSIIPQSKLSCSHYKTSLSCPGVFTPDCKLTFPYPTLLQEFCQSPISGNYSFSSIKDTDLFQSLLHPVQHFRAEGLHCMQVNSPCQGGQGWAWDCFQLVTNSAPPGES